MRDIKKIPLLTPAQEKELARRIRKGDLILAIDLDIPDAESSPSYDVCVQLANRIMAEEHRSLAVASIKGQNQKQILKAILQE